MVENCTHTISGPGAAVVTFLGSVLGSVLGLVIGFGGSVFTVTSALHLSTDDKGISCGLRH